MKKTVITPVGISLLENVLLKRTQLPLSFGLPSIREVEDLNHRCEYGSLTPQEAVSLEDPEVRRIAERFEGAFSTLWDSQAKRYTINGGQRKREYSPAELASLSLLDLQNGDADRDPDRVVLLYSETARGAFCAAVLERLLGRGVAVPAGLEIKKRMIEGLQLEDLGRFTNVGMVEYARTVEQVVDAQDAGTSVLLNITGGYKGVAPIATIVAMALGVEVCYLYEESDEMLFLPPLDVRFRFSRLFENYEPIMAELAPRGRLLPRVAEEQFLEIVVEEHRDEFEKYLQEADGELQLSPPGVLAWILHTCRGETGRASPSGPLTHD
jgi:putative CRISPR-associated protein (TIGR02619 family)